MRVAALLLSFALSGSALAAPLPIGPPRPIEQVVFGPMLAGARDVQIACGSERCLAVWADGRGISAQRLGPDGKSQDQSSFVLAWPIRYQAGPGNPSVAADGPGFLVTWARERHVEGARVSAQGEVTRFGPLHPGDPMQFPSIVDLRVAVGADGALLVWTGHHLRDSGTVFAQRLGRQGTLAGPRLQLAVAPRRLRWPDVVWTGQHYLVVWHDDVTDQRAEAAGVRVMADGTVLDPGGFKVGDLGAWSHEPRLAAGGSGVLLVAGAVEGSQNAGVDVLMLDGNGRNARRMTLAPTANFFSINEPAVTWDGTQFVVTFIEAIPGFRLLGMRFGADGTPKDLAGITLATHDSSGGYTARPAIAALNGQAFVLFGRRDPLTSLQLIQVALRADGTVVNSGGTPFVVAGNPQRLLAGAHGAGGTLIVYTDDRDGEARSSLRLARIDDQGMLAGTSVVTSGGAYRKALAVPGPDGFLVVYWPGESGAPSPRMFRVSAAGQLLDATPVVLQARTFGPEALAVAAMDGGYLLVWDDFGGRMLVRRLGRDLQPMGTDVQLTGQGRGSSFAAIGTGDSALVLWHEQVTGVDARLVRVAADGAFVPAAGGIRLPAFSPWDASNAWLISDGQKVLIARDQDAMLVDRSGPPVAGPRLPVGTNRPTWDGRAYTWAPPLNGLAPVPEIEVHQMTPDGTRVPDATKLPFAGPPPGDRLVVGIGGGASLLAYTRLDPERSAGTFRIEYRLVGVGGDPGASEAGADGGAGDSGTAEDAPADSGVGTSGDAPADGGVDAPGDDPDAGAADSRADAGGDGPGEGDEADCDCDLGGARTARREGAPWLLLVMGIAMRIFANRRRRRR